MEITARLATVHLAETFVIARDASDSAEVVQVEVRHGDTVGHGEGAPIARYDESAASALAWFDGVTIGADPWALDAIHASLPPGEMAARSALDAALHDLQGKLANIAVYRLLGLRRSARRRPGPSGSATPTTWPAAPRKPPRR